MRAGYFLRLAETESFHTGVLEHFIEECDDDTSDIDYTVEVIQHV